MSHEKGIEAARAELEIQWGTAFIVDGIVDAAKLDMAAIIAAYLAEAQPTSEGEEREAFESVMRLHFKLPNATFDWAEDTPWMTDPNNTNGDIIDCDDFWFGWQYALAGEK